MENYPSIIEELFRAHHKGLCNVAYHIVGSRDAGEDIVQDVFLKVWRKHEELEWGPAMKGYLYRAVSNAALNALEKQSRVVPLNEEVEGRVDTLQGSDDELKAKVKAAIASLPPKCRAIFILSRKHGLKYKEIAEYLDVSPRTVENQMGIALGKLRERLKAHLGKITPVIATLINLLSL